MTHPEDMKRQWDGLEDTRVARLLLERPGVSTQNAVNAFVIGAVVLFLATAAWMATR